MENRKRCVATNLKRLRRIEAFRTRNIERLRTNAEDERCRRVAAKIYLKMIDKWELSNEEAAELLNVPLERIAQWRQGDLVEMDEFVFEKISYLTGIYKLLCLVYEGQEALVSRWMTVRRDSMGCYGNTPFQTLTYGGVNAFAMMRLVLQQILDDRDKEDSLE